MLKTRFVVGMFSVAMMVLGTGVVCAQAYPNKPLRIVTGGIGGSNDFVARLIAQGISGPLGQSVVVDNRPGGFNAAETASKALPDGNTVLVSGSGIWYDPLTRKTPYDPVTDFAPITIVGRLPAFLIVTSSLPVNSVKELIALAKAKPGEFNYSSAGIASTGHLTAELFKSMTGVNIVHIPYNSGSQEVTDLISGRVQLTFTGQTSTLEQIKLGRLRALAVTSATPSALMPGLPTLAALGLLDFESQSTQAVFVPAKTPEAKINRLNHEIVQFVNQPSVKEKFLTAGIEVVGSSPGELAARMKREMARWGKLIKDAGIRAE